MGEEIINFKGKKYLVSTVEDLHHVLDDIKQQELNDNERNIIDYLLKDVVDFLESDISNDIECIRFMNEIIEELEKISIINAINYMESLVWKRFDNKKQLQEELSKHFNCNVELKKQTYCSGSWEEQEEYDNGMLDLDYGFIGNIDNEEIFCDIDIYYAKTRANKGNGIIITEVNYEFETNISLEFWKHEDLENFNLYMNNKLIEVKEVKE